MWTRFGAKHFSKNQKYEENLKANRNISMRSGIPAQDSAILLKIAERQKAARQRTLKK